MQLSPHCYGVTGFAYIPPWSVNAGFIAGNEQTLIVDSGPTATAAATILGYARAARPSNLVLAVNTEQHLDHIGGNGHLRGSGIEVYGHAGIRRQGPELRNDIDEFNACVSNTVRRERREGEILFAGTQIVNPNRTITSNIMFDLGSLTAEVILTPGHTPTNLCVYVPGDRILFCGDCVTSGYLPNLEGGNVEAWRQWLSSLDRIGGLAIDALVCGHGPVVRDAEVAPAIARVRSIVEEAISAGKAPTSP